MEAKTNAMRILDKLKVSYKHYRYDADKAVSGAEVAAILGENPAQVFKTLVTVAKSKKYCFQNSGNCCQIEEILCFYVAGIIRA